MKDSDLAASLSIFVTMALSYHYLPLLPYLAVFSLLTGISSKLKLQYVNGAFLLFLIALQTIELRESYLIFTVLLVGVSFVNNEIIPSFLISLVPGFVTLSGLFSQAEIFLTTVAIAVLLFSLNLDRRGLIISGIAFLLFAGYEYSISQSLSTLAGDAVFYYLLTGVISIAVQDVSIPSRLKKQWFLGIVGSLPLSYLAIMRGYPLGEPYYYWNSLSFYYKFSNILSLWIPGKGTYVTLNQIFPWVISHLLPFSGLLRGEVYLALAVYLAGISTFASLKLMGINFKLAFLGSVLYQLSFLDPVIHFGTSTLAYALAPLFFSSVISGKKWDVLPAVFSSVVMASSPPIFVSALVTTYVYSYLTLRKLPYVLITLGVNAFWLLPTIALEGIFLTPSSVVFPVVALLGIAFSAYYFRQKGWMEIIETLVVGLFLSIIGIPSLFLEELLSFLAFLRVNSRTVMALGMIALSIFTVGFSASAVAQREYINQETLNQIYSLDQKLTNSSLLLVAFNSSLGYALSQPFTKNVTSYDKFLVENNSLQPNPAFRGYPLILEPVVKPTYPSLIPIITVQDGEASLVKAYGIYQQITWIPPSSQNSFLIFNFSGKVIVGNFSVVMRRSPASVMTILWYYSNGTGFFNDISGNTTSIFLNGNVSEVKLYLHFNQSIEIISVSVSNYSESQLVVANTSNLISCSIKFVPNQIRERVYANTEFNVSVENGTGLVPTFKVGEYPEGNYCFILVFNGSEYEFYGMIISSISILAYVVFIMGRKYNISHTILNKLH
ncbi:hypothetical protein HS7_06420 [Sulfolobales archaeon HS-7]|nr:hypothetical protein HS7_06420 [Sulfolobales archaeon HS-7]